LVLILENWLQLVQAAPSNRPDVGPLHFIAFLITYLDELEDPKKDTASNVKNQDVSSKIIDSGRSPRTEKGSVKKKLRNILELRVKVKALFIFMLYGFIIETSN